MEGNVVTISRSWLVSIGLSLVLVALLWGVSSATAQGPVPEGEVGITAAVSSKINYQGVLKEGGTPVTGTRNMVFWFYSDAACTAQVGAGIAKTNVPVADGLFSVDLPVAQNNFNGQALWLRVEVGATAIGCQEILPVPYALSLRPGAAVAGPPLAWAGSVLEVGMDGAYPSASAVYGHAATGYALRGDSAGGLGVYGYTQDGYAVYGYDAGALTARGYGGYFASSNGIGVYGYSGAPSFYTNMYAPGVYGRSANGTGVYGRSDSAASWQSGVLGEGTSGRGVTGSSTSGVGVYGSSSGTPASGGYAGYFYSANYRGIYAMSQAGYYDAYFGGTGGIYVNGDVWASRSNTGYVTDLALNDGSERLEAGDVVVIVGVADPVLGENPVVRVKKADAAGSTGVMGVVDRQLVIDPAAEQDGGAGFSGRFVEADAGIASGGYAGIVTRGAFTAIKVDASYGAIQPGDLLVSSPNPGHAMKAVDPKLGTVIGKALEGLDAGTGVIAVLITLQ